MRKAILTIAAASLIAAGLSSAPALADTWDWRDPGGSGPLSIKSIRAEHGSFGPYLRIRFDRPVNPKAWGPKDFVVADIEIDGRGKSERWVYFVSVRNQLRTFTYYPKTKAVVTDNIGFGGGPYNISFPSLDAWEHGYYGGHAFAIGSYSKAGCGDGCWDVVPQRGYLVHDYTAPELPRFSVPQGYWSEPQLPVTWRVKDRGLSGISEAVLLRSEAGSGQWRRVMTRREPGTYEASLAVSEGAHVMLQLAARDGAGNVTRSPLTTTRVPYDQAGEAAPGTFSGLWTEEADPMAVGGTVQTSTLPFDSLSVPGRGNEYCVILKWLGDSGSATLEAGDSSTPLTHPAPDSAALTPHCVRTDTIEERAATLTVESGRLSVDGYWAGVAGRWSGNGTLRPRRTAEAGDETTPALVRGIRPAPEDLERIIRSTRRRLSLRTMRSPR